MRHASLKRYLEKRSKTLLELKCRYDFINTIIMNIIVKRLDIMINDISQISISLIK